MHNFRLARDLYLSPESLISKPFRAPSTGDRVFPETRVGEPTWNMSGPAFGFSAGDFIAGVTLIVNVTKALKDAGGASDEYRSLVQELGLLERILKQLHARQGQGATNVFAADVTQQTDLTLTTLSSFLETISKFDAKLGEQAPSAWHHGTARKAQWAVTCAKEIEKLRVKVGTHLSELNLLFQLQTSAGYVLAGGRFKLG